MAPETCLTMSRLRINLVTDSNSTSSVFGKEGGSASEAFQVGVGLAIRYAATFRGKPT